MADWIDAEKARRDQGHHRPLLQSQHAEVNARYPGCTLEYCYECGAPTGWAGKGEDSLYTEGDTGPFCWECFPEKEETATPPDPINATPAKLERELDMAAAREGKQQ